jgi:hypothetical protein
VAPQVPSRLDVSAWELRGIEQAGLSPHPWLADPVNDDLWLFKPVEIKNGHQQGEDWAESVVAQVSAACGVPCAPVRLAHRHGRDGSLSRNVVPDGWRIQPGSVLLAGQVEGYTSRAQGRPGHTLENIHLAIRDSASPPGFGLDRLSGSDTFAAYLMLDALVANRDRHDDNWAVLQRAVADASWSLAPSYDHASSLGFSLRDVRRRRLLSETDGLERWAARGTAWRFEHRPGRPLETLVELALRALQSCDAAARNHWVDRLHALDAGQLETIVAGTAGMSDAARTFALELLTHNKTRLLHGLHAAQGGGS